MFPVGMFPVGMFASRMFPPGSTAQQVLPVIPLPSVGGFEAPSQKDSFELEDERIIMEMIKLFLKGRN